MYYRRQRGQGDAPYICVHFRDSKTNRRVMVDPLVLKVCTVGDLIEWMLDNPYMLVYPSKETFRWFLKLSEGE